MATRARPGSSEESNTPGTIWPFGKEEKDCFVEKLLLLCSTVVVWFLCCYVCTSFPFLLQK